MRAIHEAIDFVCALPQQTNNCTNAECQIWQCETQQAKLCQSTTSPQVSLPHPGTNVYRPPMLWDQPPHLDLATYSPSEQTTAKSHDATSVGALTQLDSITSPDLEIPSVNPQKIKKIHKKSLKKSKNLQKIPPIPQLTSNGNIEDLTPHTPPLVLPLSKEKETDLIKLIPLDDWEKWKFGWEGLTTTWEGLTPI